jgi:hypothetical protein
VTKGEPPKQLLVTLAATAAYGLSNNGTECVA